MPQCYQATRCGPSASTWMVRKSTTDTIPVGNVIKVSVDGAWLCSTVDRETVYESSEPHEVADSGVTSCFQCTDS